MANTLAYLANIMDKEKLAGKHSSLFWAMSMMKKTKMANTLAYFSQHLQQRKLGWQKLLLILANICNKEN